MIEWDWEVHIFTVYILEDFAKAVNCRFAQHLPEFFIRGQPVDIPGDSLIIGIKEKSGAEAALPGAGQPAGPKRTGFGPKREKVAGRNLEKNEKNR